MNRDCGDIGCKVWLIGDSEPDNYSEELQNPFDWKHPTVHNIFTPILYQIQEDLFDTGHWIDRNKLYIRNAVEKSSYWKNEANLNKEILNFRHLVNEYSPIIILSFGSRAFEFVRRALDKKDEKSEKSKQSKPFDSWSTYELGTEFAERCRDFNVSETNIIPLLHASICRGKFLEAHSNFCAGIRDINKEMNEENYFIATGEMLSKIISDNKNSLNCWKETFNRHSTC